MENMQASESIVRIDGLSHRYAKHWAVSNVNIEIPRKGVIGLLGANGAGKSTIMNSICGVIHPSRGDVWIDGYSIRLSPIEAKSKFGFLPQQAPLYPELTIDEYLGYCSEIKGATGNRDVGSIEYVKARCGIEHLSKRLIGALSGGYRQRVGIAQALLHEPSFIVLDEPTNGLDPNQILEVRKLIQETAHDRAVLLSTHMLAEVEAICRRIIMIDKGEIVFDGDLEDFSNVVRPNTLVASFDNPPAPEELDNIPGVTGTTRKSPKKMQVSFDADVDMGRKLVDLSVAKGWGLREMYFERARLEDVFAALSVNRV